MVFYISDPVGILTQDLQNRNLTLYTAELRGLFAVAKITNFSEPEKHFLKSESKRIRSLNQIYLISAS